MKIYTKTGDRGQTGLIGGSRVEKTDLRIHAIGEVDELNAALGLVNAPFLIRDIREIQCRLFELGALLADPRAADEAAEFAEHSKLLETSMDRQTAELPQLRNFILPGGSEEASRLHLARAVCRRAERAVLALFKDVPIQQDILVFLNRLSDWLFVAARTSNKLAGIDDVPWVKS